MQLPKNIRRKRSFQKGFTLIEMLMVVAILAIMVSIAVPAVRTAKADAQAAKRNTMINAIELAKLRCTLANVTPKTHTPLHTSQVLQYYSYTQFKKYLRVNGVVAPPIATVTKKENNGCGYDIGFWGMLNPDIYSNESYRKMDFNIPDSEFEWDGPILNEDEIFTGAQPDS